MKPLELRVDLNVIDHLGIGLYSKTPAVMTEIIANGWDADANVVKVTLDADNDLIVVEDDGHGMSRADVQEKFLNVGYRRRDHDGALSKKYKRHVMGRKGIGKLAMFSLADKIDIVTKTKSSSPISFSIEVPELRKRISKGKPYELLPTPEPAKLSAEHGTRITLTRLNSRINKTEVYLVPRLARRFSILGDLFDFKLEVNGKAITREHRGFYGDVQFLWYFDNQSLTSTRPLTTSLASVEVKSGKRSSLVECTASLPGTFRVKGKAYKVSGYIATVDKPKKLGRGDETINMISVFANGRVFEEDVLADLGSARVFNSYIVGEVHADFLDRDGIDRATASREAVKRDDELYQGLRTHINQALDTIRDAWDEWRQQLGFDKAGDAIPEISDWISGLPDERDRRIANKLMTSISNLSIANDEGRERDAKAQLYRSTIVSFEKLRLRNKLSVLENITDVLSPEFRAIFTTIDDVEETSFFDITRSRLEVIRRFEEEIVTPKKLEKVAQKYLFDHLWLLDPAWDRVSGSPEMEQNLTRELKRACPEETRGARLDIAYRTSAGRHVIVELKRPGLRNLSFNKLLDQGRKYRKAMKQYLADHPDMYGLRGNIPPIDIYLLVEEKPQMDENDKQALEAQSIAIRTYAGLIQNARTAYAEYLAGKKKLGSLEKLLAALS